MAQKTQKKVVTISIDEETHKRLKEIAEANHTTVSQWITDQAWAAEERLTVKDITELFQKMKAEQ